MGDEFVAYYQQLLGTSKTIVPLDSAVIQCGPCLPPSSHGFLLSPVSHEDIHPVVFSIENEKAPDPDGYSFFKQAWSVVGGDFCAAVQDFFHSGKLLKQVLATPSLLWSPNQRMSLLHLISGLFPVVMLFIK